MEEMAARLIGSFADYSKYPHAMNIDETKIKTPAMLR